MCERCGWEEFAQEIAEMQDDPRYDWADATLDGIRQTVESNEHATDGQLRAIENIRRRVESRSG